MVEKIVPDLEAGPQNRRFERIKPLLSRLKRPLKTMGKVAAGVALVSTIAIGGANLGTYFDYTYHNYNYSKLGNRTKLTLAEGQTNNELLKMALETAKLPVIGNTPPQEAILELRLDETAGRLSARYAMVWSTNKGVEKRDAEEVIITWNLDRENNRFIPDKATTRYHYKWVEFALSDNENLTIVIQNPAHTPGIPGSNPRYINQWLGEEPELVDVFTMFASQNWAGSSLATGLPHKFKALEVNFETEIKH